MRILFASTVPVTLNSFMCGQLAWIASQGHEVHVVSSPGPELTAIGEREGVHVHALPMDREISLSADLRALWGWLRLLRRLRPDITVVGTPKAGLVGGLAALAVRIPRRVYLMRGARFEGESGARGAILRLTERISCAAAHQVIAVSSSLAEKAVKEGIVKPDKVLTVGSGSSNGVDAVRFHQPSEEYRRTSRELWRLEADDVAIAFVGRLARGKGLQVLREALEALEASGRGRYVVMLAGPDEGAGVQEFNAGAVTTRVLGNVDDIPSLLQACDILVLPTQREGFPNVVLEAAACGLPVVTTDATGAVDSVINGRTGFVVGKRDSRSMAEALARLGGDPGLRRSMGLAARRRVEREFTNESVWCGMLQAYLGAGSDGIPHIAEAGCV